MKKRFTTLFFFVSFLVAQAQTWVQKSDFPGGGRTGAASFAIGNTAYVGLGAMGSNYFKDFWKYEAGTDTWTQVADFPGASRSAVVAFVLNGKGYVGLGEVVSGTFSYFADFYEYNPSTDTWTQMPDFTGGARSRAVAFVIGGNAYVGSGKGSGSEAKDFFKFDGTSWSAAASLSDAKARTDAAAFAINGKGYISGGVKGVNGFTDMMQYDPVANAWTEKIFADANLSFQRAAAFAVNGKGYIFYGNKKIVSQYDPQTNGVTNLGDLLGNLGVYRRAPIAFITNDKAYVGMGCAATSGLSCTEKMDLWQWSDLVEAKETVEPFLVKVKPTLVTNAFRLESNHPLPATNKLYLFSYAGQKLASWTNITSGQSFDVYGLEPGYYHLQLKAGEKTFTEKIIKQ